MNTLKSNIFLVALSISFMILLGAGQAFAENLETQEKALKIISDFAERLCTIPLEGKSNNLQLSGNAKLELRNLLKRLADLGVNGATKYQSSKWEGILQKDLAGLIAKKIDCKKEVWNDLKDRIDLRSAKSEKQQKRDNSPRGVSRDGKSSIVFGDIKDNKDTQININSPNPIQNINNPRRIKEVLRIENEEKEGLFITRIIMEQTKGIWNQGVLFKFSAKLSAPYLNYEFIKGMPGARMNWATGDNPEKGIIYIETTTAPLEGQDIVVEIKSKTQVTIEAAGVEPLEKK